MKRIDRVKRFIKFLDQMVSDGDWEYGWNQATPGTRMTDDARAARAALREWMKTQEPQEATK